MGSLGPSSGCWMCSLLRQPPQPAPPSRSLGWRRSGPWRKEGYSLCSSRCLDGGRQVPKALLTEKESRENELYVSAKFFPMQVSVTGILKHEREWAKLFCAVTDSVVQTSSRLLNTQKIRLPRAFQSLFPSADVAHSCSKVSLQLKPPVGPWVRGRMGGSLSCQIPVSPSSSQEQNPKYGIFRTICTKSLEF